MRSAIVVTLLVCVGPPAILSQGANDPDAGSKLIALEHVWRLQAVAAKDVRTLNTILDDAFVSVDSEGALMTKAEVLESIRTATALRYQADAIVVRLHGDTAIVTGLYRTLAVVRGAATTRQGRFVDTWLRVNGQWVAVASLSVPVE